MPLALTLVGLALQLAGAAVTYRGVRLIWREAATGGERLLDPAVGLAHRVWRRLTDPFLRWIGRPRSQTVEVSAVSSLGFASSARAHKSYQPLASDLAVRDAVAELERRIQAITADIGRVESRLLDKLEDQTRRHNDLSQAFSRYVGEQDQHARQRDLRGIRFEAAGLALVTLGAIVQALSQAAAS